MKMKMGRRWDGIHSDGRRRDPIAVRNYHKNRANSVRDFKVSDSILGVAPCFLHRWWLASAFASASFLIFPSYALSFLLYLILIRISHFTIKLIGHAAAELHPSKRDTRTPSLGQLKPTNKFQSSIRDASSSWCRKGMAKELIVWPRAREAHGALLIYANIDSVPALFN